MFQDIPKTEQCKTVNKVNCKTLTTAIPTMKKHPTDSESNAASDPDDPTIAWCPPTPDAADDPTELEIASAADQLAVLISKTKPAEDPFCHPDNLVLPPLWLQARLQLTLPAIQEKFTRILVSVAGKLWLRREVVASR